MKKKSKLAFKELERELSLVTTTGMSVILGGNSSGDGGGYWGYANGAWEYTYNGGTIEEVVIRPGDSSGDDSSGGNWYGNYLGPNNPPNYNVEAISMLDYYAMYHDLGYDERGAAGIMGAMTDYTVIDHDLELAMQSLSIATGDPYSASYGDVKQRLWAAATATGFSIITLLKGHMLANSITRGLIWGSSGN